MFRDLARIQDGEQVAAGVANRPLDQLLGNDQYLLNLLQASNLLSSQVLLSVPVDEVTQVGTPVYFDSVRKVYAPAQALAEATAGLVVPSESCHVVGLVLRKHSAAVADLLTSGCASVDIRPVTGGTRAAGVYYLSAAARGLLSPVRQPILVPVLVSDGQGGVRVVPYIPDLLDKHLHYRFPLVCRPAGNDNNPSSNSTHTILNPDAVLPGWLPANHASFGGKAPPGAVFGYNLAAHPDLKAVWPPTPASEVYLSWDRGRNRVGATGVPLGPNGACIVDANGIWWLSNCYGDVPWPLRVSTAGFSLSLSDPVGAECPRQEQMELTLYFAKVSYSTEATSVNTLASNHPKYRFLCADDTVGTAGNLVLDVVAPTRVQNTVGGLVVKEITDAGDHKIGPVCEGIFSQSPLVSLRGTYSRRKVLGDDTSPLVYQGLVEVIFSNQAGLELPVTNFRLDGVQASTVEGVSYYAFPPAQVTSISGQIDVPSVTGFSAPTLALRLRLLGRTAGNLPALTVTARRIPKPGASPTAIPTSGSDFSVTVTTTAAISGTNKYIEVTSTPFSVADGDSVVFSIRRNSGDGYTGDVGLLRVTGLVAAP